jgi:hypothetical protein
MAALTKWKAHGGVLLCEKIRYTAYDGNLILPGSKENNSYAFRVLDIGPGVEGYEVGDLLIVARVFETPEVGCWVRSVDIYGKLPVADVPEKYLLKDKEPLKFTGPADENGAKRAETSSSV